MVKGEDSEEYQKKVSINTQKEVEVKVAGEIDIKADKALKVKAQSLSSQTDQKTELKGSEIEAEATQLAKVKANSGVEVNGGTSATLKGTSVTVDGTSTSVQGNASLDLKTAKGSRSGMWNDQ